MQKEHGDDLERDAEDGWVETSNPESKTEKVDDIPDLDDDGGMGM